MTGEPTLFDQPLARRSDPETSHRAARSLTHKLTDKHRVLLAWLESFGPATDDKMADRMVASNQCARHEQARRIVRTLREQYGYIVPALDDDGNQRETVNSSGRMARMWAVSPDSNWRNK
jgi:hypothetical protein